jgi:hypothetical protein
VSPATGRLLQHSLKVFMHAAAADIVSVHRLSNDFHGVSLPAQISTI